MSYHSLVTQALHHSLQTITREETSKTDISALERRLQDAEARMPIRMIFALREAASRAFDSQCSPTQAGVAPSNATVSGETAASPPEPVLSAPPSSSWRLASMLGAWCGWDRGEGAGEDMELQVWGEKVPVSAPSMEMVTAVLEDCGVDLTEQAAWGLGSLSVHWRVMAAVPSVRLALATDVGLEQVGVLELRGITTTVLRRAGGGWDVDAGVQEVGCVCPGTSSAQEGGVAVVEMGEVGRETKWVSVSVKAPGPQEQAAGQRHVCTASVSPFVVCIRPSICVAIGAWMQRAIAMLVHEDRFAVGDAGVMASTAADSGRHGALAAIRQAIIGPWAGQQGGGNGWEVSLDLVSPNIIIAGDEYRAGDPESGPSLRVHGGRIVVNRVPTVTYGQKFEAEWSGCDAVLTLPCRGGGKMRGGVLWASIEGSAALTLTGFDASRKCVAEINFEPVGVSVTEGHVAAAAEIIQRFATRFVESGWLGGGVIMTSAPRGVGESLAVALQNLVARSAMAAERFNWFRLLQAGLKNKKSGQASVVSLELEV